MQRRKFILGMGAVAAGGTAALGTGAITDSSMERGIVGRVAADNAAYIQIEPSGNAGNEEHLRYDSSSGEMQLFFGDIGSGGAGLNPDSINRFDVVFTVENQNPSPNSAHTYFVWVEDSHSRLRFYVNSQQSNTIEAAGDAEAMSDWGGAVPVGVEIDLRDSGLGAGDSLSDALGTNGDDDYVLHVEKTNGSPP